MNIDRIFKMTIFITVVLLGLSACGGSGSEEVEVSDTFTRPRNPDLRAKIISMPDFVKNIAAFPLVVNVDDYLVQYHSPADNARVYTARFKGKYFNLVCEIGNTYKGLSVKDHPEFVGPVICDGKIPGRENIITSIFFNVYDKNSPDKIYQTNKVDNQVLVDDGIIGSEFEKEVKNFPMGYQFTLSSPKLNLNETIPPKVSCVMPDENKLGCVNAYGRGFLIDKTGASFF